MKNSLKALMIGAGLLASTTAFADTFSVQLGDTTTVGELYSYPNNGSMTIDQSVEHYLTQSLQRDGYGDSTVTASTINGQVYANFSGSVPSSYANTLTTFLDTGRLALTGTQQLMNDGKWQSGWYFFLPQGMAMRNHKTVELLHFPPDTSLLDYQDYLNSATTNRWDTMLQANGINASDTPLYQTIIDLAPIAAPASAGSSLSDTYSYYSTYVNQMLDNWTVDPIGQNLAVVAFGSPVRSWVESTFNVSLDIDQVATITLDNGKQVSILGSNHPSYIWYTSSVSQGEQVMLQDAIASCWQARMGEVPSVNPTYILGACKSYWQSRPTQICIMYYEQAKDYTPAEAQAACQNRNRIEAAPNFLDASASLDTLSRHGNPAAK